MTKMLKDIHALYCHNHIVKYLKIKQSSWFTTCFSHFIHPQMEMGEKEQKLETLQSKVSELKKCSESQETPAKLQVLKMNVILNVLFL